MLLVFKLLGLGEGVLWVSLFVVVSFKFLVLGFRVFLC